MARDLRPKHKLCRRFGEKLCDAQKCPVARRSYPSGQHGPQQKHVKLSGFGKQLREKQKAKRMYGILEKQFSNYVAEASKKTGDTSKILLSYLESRLDNIVYRMGLAPTRSAARQLVNHGHIKVNDKKVDIPSFRVKVGDPPNIHADADLVANPSPKVLSTNAHRKILPITYRSNVVTSALFLFIHPCYHLPTPTARA
jgi:small subunit ribosomal protein S4